MDNFSSRFCSYIYLFICKLIGGILITIIGLVNITKSKQIIKICLFYALNFVRRRGAARNGTDGVAIYSEASIAYSNKAFTNIYA